MAEIVVAIPTFKRTKALARLLAALEQLDTEDTLIVVVAETMPPDMLATISAGRCAPSTAGRSIR